MNKIKNTPFYISVIILFILLKLGYKYSETNNLIFLLKPTKELVALLIGYEPVFTKNGYFFKELNMIIVKSCSGFNLWLISFIMLSFLFLNYTEKIRHKVIGLICAFLLGYFFTICVNASRIYSTIIFQDKIYSYTSIAPKIIHEAIGITINITFLIAIYVLAEKIINKNTDAKFFKT